MNLFDTKNALKNSPHLRTLMVVASLLLTVLFTTNVQAREQWKGVEKIIAIGDVHGDYQQYLKILDENQLIDAELNWTGGKIHLVQLGDVVDRGPDSLLIMRHLKKLHRQAKKTKGYVHMLLGNHEVMNIKDDVRYVHPGEYKILINKDSQRKQQSYLSFVFASLLKANPALSENKSQKMSELSKQFPLGYVEHRFIWAKKGEFFEWAKRNNTVIKINRTLFTHGGISPHRELSPIKHINKEVKRVITSKQDPLDNLQTGNNGPLWYRGLATHSREKELEPLVRMLEHYDADSIVIAHTPTPGTVIPRFDGLVVMVDVGISAHYGARRANLIIEGSERYVMHRGSKVVLPTNTSDLLSYLETVSAKDPKPSPLLNAIDRLKLTD